MTDLLKLLKSLQSKNFECATLGLRDINIAWANQFEFDSLTEDLKRQLFDALKFYLDKNDDDNSESVISMKISALEFSKILSRDKKYSGTIEAPLPDREFLELLIKILFLSENLVINSAQKCLSNFVFQNQLVRQFCKDSDLINKLNGRLDTVLKDDIAFSEDICFHDLRLLFMMTALCPEIRYNMEITLKTRNTLIGLLEKIVTYIINRTDKNVQDPMLNIVCEVLKVLFNVTMSIKMKNSDENELELKKLMALIRDLVTMKCSSEEKNKEGLNHIVNLLTAIPSKFYLDLTPKNYAGNIDFGFMDILVTFLEERLDVPVKDQKDVLSPIMTLLIDMARSSKELQKYLRSCILPPLTDVSQRPEEGNTIRNKLVKLMTSVTEINIASAELLFHLCNCNVNRLIKYTGFGNAAGLLALRGLLAGGSCQTDHDDSDDDTDSDTEEYRNAAPHINPVLGCVDPTLRLPSPLAGMSDEQKEFEAMQLVNQIDKLIGQGVVLPGRIDEDGKIQPIEHVMQLQASSIKNPKSKTSPNGNGHENDELSSDDDRDR